MRSFEPQSTIMSIFMLTLKSPCMHNSICLIRFPLMLTLESLFIPVVVSYVHSHEKRLSAILFPNNKYKDLFAEILLKIAGLKLNFKLTFNWFFPKKTCDLSRRLSITFQSINDTSQIRPWIDPLCNINIIFFTDTCMLGLQK